MSSAELPDEGEAILEVAPSKVGRLLKVSVKHADDVKTFGEVRARKGVEERIKRLLLCEGWIKKGIFFRFTPHSDESVVEAVSTALERGSASFKVRARGFKLAKEEKLLTKHLRTMGFRVVKCAIIEGYTVDLLLPKYDVAIELAGLTRMPGYEGRASEKDPEKLKHVTGKKGYRICWIDIEDVRRAPKRIARLIAQVCDKLQKERSSALSQA